MKKLFIGNLSQSTSEQDLTDMFEQFGPILSCRLMRDRDTQASRGFAFVEVESDERAADAIRELNDTDLKGKQIQVNEARPREENGRGGGWAGRSEGSSNRFNGQGQGRSFGNRRPSENRRFR